MMYSESNFATFNSLDFQLTHNQHWTNLSSYNPLATILLPSCYLLPTIFLLSSYLLATFFLLSSYLLPSGFLEHTLNVASSYLGCTLDVPSPYLGRTLDVPCHYFVFTKRINPSQIVLYYTITFSRICNLAEN